MQERESSGVQGRNGEGWVFIQEEVSGEAIIGSRGRRRKVWGCRGVSVTVKKAENHIISYTDRALKSSGMLQSIRALEQLSGRPGTRVTKRPANAGPRGFDQAILASRFDYTADQTSQGYLGYYRTLFYAQFEALESWLSLLSSSSSLDPK